MRLPVRRLFAILLFAAFLLPSVLPAVALARTSDAGLPACCRRDGAHHCGMPMAQQAVATAKGITARRWQAPVERCPYCPATLGGVHANPLAGPLAAVGYAEFFGHPAATAQTESRWRIARDRSRQKRGPPAAPFA